MAMTKRDLVWDCALRLGTGMVDPDELWDEDAWWDREGMFCHDHIREVSNELDRSNKRTINRTLNEMVELGWLTRHELTNVPEDSDFLNIQPYLYELSEPVEEKFASYPNTQLELSKFD